jgi:RimJ/RimL family protein N-acetyltransferase
MENISLRQWLDSDLEPYAAMNCDPEVMQFFPALLDRQQTAASLARQRGLIDQRGWGLWAVEVDGNFAGFTGLAVPGFQADFTPCVEIGWRLRREYWGRGIASQAARQALKHGFDTLKLPEIVSFTAVANARSRRLMERLDFSHFLAGDFDHPSIPEGHQLRRHVLYRKKAQAIPSQNLQLRALSI